MMTFPLRLTFALLRYGAMTSAGGAAEGLAADGGSLGTPAAGWTSAAGARARAALSHGAVTNLFARSVRDYTRQHACPR